MRVISLRAILRTFTRNPDEHTEAPPHRTAGRGQAPRQRIAGYQLTAHVRRFYRNCRETRASDDENRAQGRARDQRRPGLLLITSVKENQ